MAYRKRVGLGKGLHLNFSGSGVGIGYRLFPGLSISANSNGLYCNSSISGSGFYSRNKVCGWGSGIQNTKNNDQPKGQVEVEFLFHSYIDENDEFQLEIRFNKTGELVDEYTLSQIKKQPAYKETIKTLYQKEIQELDDATEKFTDIYKLTAKTVSETDLRDSLANIKPEVFVPCYFEEKEPNREDIKFRLQKQAEQEISSVFFWTNKSKRRAFVEENLEYLYKSEHSKWQSKKDLFEQLENSRKEKELQRIESDFKYQKHALESALLGSDEYVSSQIDNILSSLEMPFNFAVSYEYEEENGLLSIQLDLPEIEDFPKRKACVLASGKLSVKSKTIFEQNSEYATSVSGLAFFFAGMFFNVSTHIKWIQVNGYTQRVNGSTGQTEDVYIYSVLFDRVRFSTINCERIKPVEALASFPCKMNCLKNAEMKGIDVFDNSEIRELIL